MESLSTGVRIGSVGVRSSLLHVRSAALIVLLRGKVFGEERTEVVTDEPELSIVEWLAIFAIRGGSRAASAALLRLVLSITNLEPIICHPDLPFGRVTYY